MMNYIAGCLLFFFLGLSSAQADYLATQLAATSALSEEEFMEQFSYEQFLKESTARSIEYYEDIARLLDNYNRPAGVFFLQLAEQQLAVEPIDIQNSRQLQQQLQLGQFLVQHEQREFQIASDIVFENLAEELEQGFKKGVLDKSDTEIMAIVEQLKAQEYGVSIPVSDMEKGLHHLQKGNLKYIWSRLWFDHPFLCVLGILGGLVLLYFFIKKIRQ